MKITIIFVIVYFLNPTLTLGHVGLDYPEGGETFNASDTVNIQWEILIDHGECNWDLFFSTDSGKTWSTVANNLPKSRLEYDWTVPAYATTGGRIKVIQDNSAGSDYEDSSGDFTIAQTTGITTLDDRVKEFFIYPAYPNPFNSLTTISFSLPKQDHVKLTIFNIAGQKIETLINNEMSSGFYKVRWEADNLPSGVYFYIVETKNITQTRKIILLK
jgi:hypothetical protein